MDLKETDAFSAMSQTTLIPSSNRKRRRLPEKVLIGYATDCNDGVAQAVRDGINVIVWSFMEIQKQQEDDDIQILPNSLEFDCIREMIAALDEEGYDDTVHLVSFGGWNGPHLDPNLTEDDWYDAWKANVGDIFHGIDWDLEGHDNLKSPTNVFAMDCLEKMGCISRLAKKDGYVIGMAPPQSYLDLQSSTFSRRVNRTEPDRPWHDEFHYFGANVYAYVLAKYGDYIDFVCIQFYESYSRAAMSLHHYDMTPEAYLESYVEELVQMGQSYLVNFDDDPVVKLSSQRVSLPLKKLVFGFANGWALDTGDKAVFFEPEKIQIAYQNLVRAGQAPRGFMFWVLGEEGTNGVHYTRALNIILQIRSDHASQRDTNEL
jgi:chitinase